MDSTSALGARAGGAAVAVTTVPVIQRDLDVTLEAIGTVMPLASVDVKPQTSSVVTRVHIQEGQFVKAGELLFTLDPRPDQASVSKVRAQMVKDEAVLADAQRQLARSRELMAKNFISQGALDSAQAQVDAQQANLVADKAALDAAQLALSYTSVRASSSGRLGLSTCLRVLWFRPTRRHWSLSPNWTPSILALACRSGTWMQFWRG